MKDPDSISIAELQAVGPFAEPASRGIRPMRDSMRKDGDPIPVAIYARVSSDRQDIHNSIEAQIEECTRYANAHNMVVVEIYRDEAASGTISARPGFQELMGDATGKDAKFSTILVWKLSRFSRNLLDSVTYQAILEKRGIGLISITEPLDDSPAGQLLKSIIQAVRRLLLEKPRPGGQPGTA